MIVRERGVMEGECSILIASSSPLSQVGDGEAKH
jgi:hypothetical protein